MDSGAEVARFIQDLSSGRNFTAFEMASDHTVKKSIIYMFFSETGLGHTGPALRWSSGAAGEARTNYILPITHITEVNVGKSTRVLRSAAAANSLEANCLSVLSRKVALNLDCGSIPQVRPWTVMIVLDPILGCCFADTY